MPHRDAYPTGFHIGSQGMTRLKRRTCKHLLIEKIGAYECRRNTAKFAEEMVNPDVYFFRQPVENLHDRLGSVGSFFDN